MFSLSSNLLRYYTTFKEYKIQDSTWNHDSLKMHKKIPTIEKILGIKKFLDAHIPSIEINHYGHEKDPLDDSHYLFYFFQEKEKQNLWSLVNNFKAFEKVFSQGAHNFSFLASPCPTYNKILTEKALEETLQLFQYVKMQTPPKFDIVYKTRVYLVSSFYSINQEKIPHEKVRELAKRFFYLGCDQIVICDTFGNGKPGDIKNLLRELKKDIPPHKISVQFRGEPAFPNLIAALQEEITSFDAALGGVGSPNKIGIEDLIKFFANQGVSIRIDYEKLIEGKRFLSERLE